MQFGKRTISSIVTTGLTILLFSGAAFAQAKTEIYQGRKISANHVLIKFKQGTYSSSQFALKQNEDIEQDDGIGGTGIRKWRSRTKNTSELIARLKARPDIEYVEPDYEVKATATTNDPYFGVLWGLQNTGQTIQGIPGVNGADIKASLAWDVSTGSRDNVVGVIDSGVDYTHPDLAANIWNAPVAFSVTIGGKTITCAAGTHGFNAITNSCDPKDDNGHGTHVSGTIGAIGNNGNGVSGINRTANIMGLKFLDASGSGYTSDAVNAIEFAIQTKIKFGASANVRVLSNSWAGTSFSQTLLDQINRANSYGILFVAAASNESNNNDVTSVYPANYKAPNIISVAATDNQDQLAYFSNYGANTVHLGAPGVNIISTYLGNSYRYASGTSMATPHVSGAASLLLSKCNLDTDQLKSTLLNNVDLITAMSGRTITGGRLNVNKAIRSCAITAPPTTCSLNVSPISVAPGQQAIYTISGTNIPSSSHAYWYGTKNGVNDAIAVDKGGSVPGSFAGLTNTAGLEGTYVRYAQIRNANGATICTTNSVTFTLQSPTSCSLTISPSIVNLGQKFTYVVSGTNLPNNSVGYWYGTKNGVVDANKVYLAAVPITLNTSHYSTTNKGEFTRRVEIRSDGQVVCTTNTISFSLK